MARPKTMPIAMSCMLKALNQDQGASLQELAEETGLSTDTLSVYLKTFARHGLVHVQSWEQDILNRYNIRRWKLGTKPDATKPAPRKLTRTEQRKRWREQKQVQATRKSRLLLNQAMHFKP